MPSLIWVNQFALLPGDGGGTRHFELGRELVRKGWRVSILASDFHLHARKYTRRADASDRRAIREMHEGVEFRWLWAAPYRHNDWRRARNWLSFYRSVMREAAGTDRPDVVIGSSPQIFAARAARALARRSGARFVFEVRDLWPESLVAAGGRRGAAYAVLSYVANGLYRDAYRILVLSRGTGDYLVRRGIEASKIIHVPNGVDVSSVRPAHRAERPLHVGATLKLIYAGAHGPANGLECVLDAAQLVPEEVLFQLVGDGPAKAQLRGEAERRGLTNVEFHDPVSRDELVKRLNEADAGLMILKDAPLFSFGVSPNKLFDYLAAALPVICNVSGEVAQLLSQSGAGIQVADASGVALREGIHALAALSMDERRNKGLAGRQWVQREHSREVLGERLDTFLREALR